MMNVRRLSIAQPCCAAVEQRRLLVSPSWDPPCSRPHEARPAAAAHGDLTAGVPHRPPSNTFRAALQASSRPRPTAPSGAISVCPLAAVSAAPLRCHRHVRRRACLLPRGAPTDPGQGASPRELLLEACRRDNTALLHEVLAANAPAAELLNTARDGIGNYCLHVAASHGSPNSAPPGAPPPRACRPPRRPIPRGRLLTASRRRGARRAARPGGPGG